MKEYKFYGWETADAAPIDPDYSYMKSARDMYDALSGVWCAYTCAPRMRHNWTKENMTLGQCSITAFLVQDIFGGDVYGILRPGGNYHCYNVVGDCVFDLTSEQFGGEILNYENNPIQSREVHFAKEEKRLRYEYLKAELAKNGKQILNRMNRGTKLVVLADREEDRAKAEALAEKLNLTCLVASTIHRVEDGNQREQNGNQSAKQPPKSEINPSAEFTEELPERDQFHEILAHADMVLHLTQDGLTLEGDGLTMRGDFTKMLPRLKQSNLEREMLVKAARIKGIPHPTVIDATAGMGEDSLLLAAAGFTVTLYEYDPIIATLLADTMERAAKIPELSEIVARMTLIEGDSVAAMDQMTDAADVILLDPMFPERQKSALIKKKFQLLHKLERPCADEEAMLRAAIKAHPRKLVIKRPVKGPYLGGIKPSHSISGKAVRYDCLVYAR